MSTFDELHEAAHNRLNLRKAQKSICLIGKRSEVTLPDFTTMTAGDLPDFTESGFRYAGRVSTDGFTFGREEETEEATSHGFAEPGRIDTTSVSRTVSTTVQETFRRVIREISKGTNYENASFDAGASFLTLDEQEMPQHEEWSMLLIFKDGPVGNEIIFGRLFATVKISEAGEEAAGTEGVLSQELTWQVFTDEEIGTPVREFYGGPGFEKIAGELGYQVSYELWASETSYSVGDKVELSGGEVLKATAAGTSGTTEPTAPAVGETVTDGDVTWERIS